MIDKDTPVMIASVYPDAIVGQLKRYGFKEFYACTPWLEGLDWRACGVTGTEEEIGRATDLYRFTYQARDDPIGCYFKSLDVVVTERCSLKCRDCANLMQYYQKPRDCSLQTLFLSVERLMGAVDHLFEFRVLGGEPFLVRDFSVIVEELIRYRNFSYIIIYTNGTVIPTGTNLECLRDPRISVHISNYGEISRRIPEIVNSFKRLGISYRVLEVNQWQDCGDIYLRNRGAGPLAEVFSNCCVSDTFTLLQGELHRCPFTAHAVNLGAIPRVDREIVPLTDESILPGDLRRQVKLFCRVRDSIPACAYCGGRDFGHADIPPAVQITFPRPLRSKL